MRKHTVVEVGGQFRSCFNQQGNGGLYCSDGLCVKHTCFLICENLMMYIKCIL